MISKESVWFSGNSKLKSLAVAGLFLSLAATQVSAQTEPAKPQLPTTPMPSGTPPTPPPPVIVAPTNPESGSETQQQPGREKEEAKNQHVPEEKNSQEEVPFMDRLMVSGNFGLQFGDWTLINLSPMVGYKFSDRFVAGPGIIYQYQSYEGLDSYHMYGGKVFGRAAVYENIFAHSEYELLNTPKFNYSTGEIEDGRLNVNSLFVGGGYRLMIGETASLDAMLLINLLESRYSPYSNPVIRIGFTGGW